MPPKPVITGAEKALGVGATGAVNADGIVGAGVNGLGADTLGVAVGLGLTVVGLVAASIAFMRASLSSLLANMMPESVPVKKVAIGIINSKNFWSIGDIAFSG